MLQLRITLQSLALNISKGLTEHFEKVWQPSFSLCMILLPSLHADLHPRVCVLGSKLVSEEGFEQLVLNEMLALDCFPICWKQTHGDYCEWSEDREPSNAVTWNLLNISYTVNWYDEPKDMLTKCRGHTNVAPATCSTSRKSVRVCILLINSPILSMTAFTLQQQTAGGVTETAWSTKAKLFTAWPFSEKTLLNPALVSEM